MITHPQNDHIIDGLFNKKNSGKFYPYSELTELLKCNDCDLKDMLGTEFFTKGGIYGIHNTKRGGYTIYGRLKA